MKNNFLVFILIIFTLLSCKNNLDEVINLNSFLHANYEFNRKTLNKYRGAYYMVVEEQPERKIEKLNELDSKYELLITNIDKAIGNKKTNIEKIVSEYHDIFTEIPKIVNHRKDYLFPELNSIGNTKINSTEFRLNTLKNKLVIAMSYAFEFASRQKFAYDGFKKLDNIDINISYDDNNGIKLTLSSDIAQLIKQNRHIVISKIQYNGKDKKVNYELNDNYSFADIVLDSLQKGNYRLEGVVRFYERTGKIDIPFNEKFKIE